MTNSILQNRPGASGKTSILLVSDSSKTINSINNILSVYCRVYTVANRAGALMIMEQERFDCVLVEMHLPGDDIINLLGHIKRRFNSLPTMVLCSAAEITTAVEAIRVGASDFVIKEVEMLNLHDRIAKLVGRTPKAQNPEEPAPTSTPSHKSWNPGTMVVGRSKRMLDVMEIARRSASFPVTILILGESGTGKGLFSHWIHRVSPRADGPFVAVNLAAIPSDLVESTLFGHEKGAFTGAIGQRTGKFGLAENGTLMLDEISELKLELQPKLLRVLQEGDYERVGGERTLQNEARIIAATNKNIYELVHEGKFRNDLLYRLNVVTITLPPLRERQEDIPDLVRLFLAKFNSAYGRAIKGLYPEALEALMDHDWPGNIRELEHAIQRSVIVAGEEYVTVKDLFDLEFQPEERLTDQLAEREGTLEELERAYIEEILQRTDGHQGQAAKILGIDRKTLYNKIMKYGIRRSLEQKSA